MVRELLMRSWCDQCMKDSEARTEATVSHVVAVDEGPALLIELCDAHGQPLVAGLALVTQLGTPAAAGDGRRQPTRVGQVRGRPRKAVPPGGTPYPCPVPDCGYVGASDKLRSQHMARSHGVTWAQWRNGETVRR